MDELPTESHTLSSIKYNMRKSLDLEQEGCYLQAGKRECLQECGFNATAKTIFIIHGWTVHEFLSFSVWVTLDKLRPSPLTE